MPTRQRDASELANIDLAESRRRSKVTINCGYFPDTVIEDYVAAEQGIERLRDAFAGYFSRFDALLLPVLPIPAHKHGAEQFVINGQTVSFEHIQAATVGFNVTGLPAHLRPAAVGRTGGNRCCWS